MKLCFFLSGKAEFHYKRTFDNQSPSNQQTPLALSIPIQEGTEVAQILQLAEETKEFSVQICCTAESYFAVLPRTNKHGLMTHNTEGSDLEFPEVTNIKIALDSNSNNIPNPPSSSSSSLFTLINRANRTCKQLLRGQNTFDSLNHTFLTLLVLSSSTVNYFKGQMIHKSHSNYGSQKSQKMTANHNSDAKDTLQYGQQYPIYMLILGETLISSAQRHSKIHFRPLFVQVAVDYFGIESLEQFTLIQKEQQQQQLQQQQLSMQPISSSTMQSSSEFIPTVIPLIQQTSLQQQQTRQQPCCSYSVECLSSKGVVLVLSSELLWWFKSSSLEQRFQRIHLSQQNLIIQKSVAQDSARNSLEQSLSPKKTNNNSIQGSSFNSPNQLSLASLYSSPAQISPVKQSNSSPSKQLSAPSPRSNTRLQLPPLFGDQSFLKALVWASEKLTKTDKTPMISSRRITDQIIVSPGKPKKTIIEGVSDIIEQSSQTKKKTEIVDEQVRKQQTNEIAYSLERKRINTQFFIGHLRRKTIDTSQNSSTEKRNEQNNITENKKKKNTLQQENNKKSQKRDPEDDDGSNGNGYDVQISPRIIRLGSKVKKQKIGLSNQQLQERKVNQNNCNSASITSASLDSSPQKIRHKSLATESDLQQLMQQDVLTCQRFKTIDHSAYKSLDKKNKISSDFIDLESLQFSTRQLVQNGKPNKRGDIKTIVGLRQGELRQLYQQLSGATVTTQEQQQQPTVVALSSLLSTKTIQFEQTPR